MTAFTSPRPSTVTMVMASSRAGNASSTSMHRMITVSDDSPVEAGHQAEERADHEPMATAASPTAATRGRRRRCRENSSRPLPSMPMMCCGLVVGAAEEVDARWLAHLHAGAEQHLVRPVGRDQRGEHGHQHEQKSSSAGADLGRARAHRRAERRRARGRGCAASGPSSTPCGEIGGSSGSGTAGSMAVTRPAPGDRGTCRRRR